METFVIQVFDQKDFLVESFKIETDKTREELMKWLKQTRPNELSVIHNLPPKKDTG